MVYTARTLINESWELSGIIAPELQSTDGYQINKGLTLLNNLLNFMQIQTEYIPYYTYNQEIECVPNQEKYFIEGCAEIDTLTFNFQEVRYAMSKQSHTTYFGSSRVNNITTLPFNWDYLRVVGGIDLYLYFIPDQAYPLNIFGKFFLADVNLNTDLSLTVDTSYIEFLRWSLADYMATQYGVSLTDRQLAILQSYRRKLMYMSPPDLTNVKVSVLTKGSSPVNLQSIGIFTGYIPTSG
jgi:hypothetical protein